MADYADHAISRSNGRTTVLHRSQDYFGSPPHYGGSGRIGDTRSRNIATASTYNSNTHLSGSFCGSLSVRLDVHQPFETHGTTRIRARVTEGQILDLDSPAKNGSRYDQTFDYLFLTGPLVSTGRTSATP
jgi:hypothetical protein